jgi:hypothetical protein
VSHFLDRAAMLVRLIVLIAVGPLLADGLIGQAAPAPAHVAMDRESASRKLQERHALVVSRESSNYKALLALTIMGDQNPLRVALAAFELRRFMGGDERDLLRRHLSRLLAESLLARPATRVKDVAAAMAYERSESASLARLQEEVFRKLIKTSLATQDVAAGLGPMPEVKVEVRQAPPSDVEVTAELRVRIPQAQGAGEPWERGCILPPASNPAWSPSASGGRSATLHCQSFNGTEQPEDFGRALGRLRAGQASVEILPARVMVLPAALEASLPYEQAVELMSRGSCFATGNCQQAFIGWLKGFAPTTVVLGFLVIQLAVAAVLLWLTRRAPLSPASRRLKWSLVYLALVVLAHAAIVAPSLQRGALVLLLGWYWLGLPLFLPGFFLGLAALAWAFNGAALRPAKIVLGVLAVTTPVLEWVLMSGVLRSGYLGG